MSAIPQDDRNKLLALANRTYISEKVNCCEWITFVSILIQSGIVDYDNDSALLDLFDHDDSDDDLFFMLRRYCSFWVDNDGMITTLLLEDMGDDHEGLERHFPIDVPAASVHLRSLNNLIVYEPQPPSDLRLTLPQLKILWVYSRYDVSCQSFLAWMGQALPNLETLTLDVGINPLRGFLETTENWSFKDSLKELDVTDCQLDQQDLENLLLDILPRLPSLSRLKLNNIRSVQGIVDTIKCSNEVRLPTSIQTLDLNFIDDENNRLGCCPRDTREIGALVDFLKEFDTIYNLGMCWSFHSRYPPEIEHALRLNHSGRRMVEDGIRAGSIYLSLFPMVLERAYMNSDQIYNLQDCRDTSVLRQELRDPSSLYSLVQLYVSSSFNNAAHVMPSKHLTGGKRSRESS